MGLIHGVQSPLVEDGVEYYSVRQGGAAEGSEAPLLWFKAIDLATGHSVKADEVSGQPGVMSINRAVGTAGKSRLKDKLAKVVAEFS